MATPISDRQRQLFVVFLLALLAAGKVIQPCLDWDTWWHLRVGQFIALELRFPDPEPFSQLGQSEKVPWIAYSWLYELLVYGCYRGGGEAGVLALRYALVMLSWGGIAWFLFRRASSGWVAVGLLALITISLRPFSSERPWHFTIFFTTLTLHAVMRVRDGAPLRRFALLPIVYVLWANIHIQFVLGFAVLGLSWVATLLEAFLAKQAGRGAVAWRLFGLGAACALATLITPFHLRLYVVIWEYATQTQALDLVQELHRPDLAEWFNWPLVALALLAAWSIARRGYRFWDMLIFASALFFSLRMQRDLWYGVLGAAAVIVHRPTDDGQSPSRPLAGGTLAGMSAAAILLVAIAWEAGLSRGKTLADSHAQTYPVGAARFVRATQLPGPLFNNFDWGGYLIWALPERPVSVDGRTNLYGEARLIRSYDTWSGEPDWENDPSLQRAGVIIAPKARPDEHGDFAAVLQKYPDTWREQRPQRSGKELTELLRLRPDRWKIVHEDETAVVYVPVTGPTP
jgi:hypothetical protein